jgi:hypothetical protein
LEAASGFEPENNGFAEQKRSHKYLILLHIVERYLRIFCRNPQPIRNQLSITPAWFYDVFTGSALPHFAKGDFFDMMLT